MLFNPLHGNSSKSSGAYFPPPSLNMKEGNTHEQKKLKGDQYIEPKSALLLKQFRMQRAKS